MKYILDKYLTHTGRSTSKTHIDILTKPPKKWEETWAENHKFKLRGTFKAYSINENPDMLKRYEDSRERGYGPDHFSLFALEWVERDDVREIQDKVKKS